MLIFLFSLMLWQGYQTPCVNIKPDLILTVISVIAKKFNNTTQYISVFLHYREILKFFSTTIWA